jgi:hypothetical protein
MVDGVAHLPQIVVQLALAVTLNFETRHRNRS